MSSFTLNLADLSNGMPGLTSSRGRSMAEAASVCLDYCGHPLEIPLTISGHFSHTPLLSRLQVDQQMENTYGDMQEATEHGAYGVAILGTCHLSGSVIVDRSVKGTGFDYWLGPKDDENVPPFMGVQRLEVSGILQNPAQVTNRSTTKAAQVAPSDSIGPAFVSIVEFSAPELRITRL